MSARAIRLLADTASGRCAWQVERRLFAGLPALEAGPREGAPTLVFANACTPRGVEQPGVAAFLGGAAGAGIHVIAPELPDVRFGIVTDASVEALVRVADECGGPVVLAGASTGGALAILAAADPRLDGRVELVSAVGPYADLANVLRLTTTGSYLDEGVLRRFPVEPRLRLAVGRSLEAVSGAPPVADLLQNTDAERFDELFATLTARIRAVVAALSPAAALPHVQAPVDIAFDPHDTFFPVAEAHALERAGANLTLTPSLGHVRPRLGLGLVQLVRFTDRLLVAQAAAS